MKGKLQEIEDEMFNELDYNEMPPNDIVAYNELRSCADLSRMHEENTLKIDPYFQREVVWKDSDQTRFIDSLIKQMPIPSMCFTLDYKTQERQVVDGLQRMATITRFLNKKEDWRLSKLTDIDQSISGKKVSEIRNKLPRLYKIIQDTTIPITILRCDFSKKTHSDYIFIIFHRLNAGGIKLNNQEIRNAIYSGPFNDMLKICNEDKKWNKIFPKKKKGSDRFKNIELILRFFAFYDSLEAYKGKLTPFLNDYMSERRSSGIEENKIKKELFERVVAVIVDKIISDKTVGRLRSNTILEAIMYGIAKNIDLIEMQNKNEVKKGFEKLIANENFHEKNISEGLLKKDKVFQRLGISKEIFAESK